MKTTTNKFEELTRQCAFVNYRCLGGCCGKLPLCPRKDGKKSFDFQVIHSFREPNKACGFCGGPLEVIEVENVGGWDGKGWVLFRDELTQEEKLKCWQSMPVSRKTKLKPRSRKPKKAGQK